MLENDESIGKAFVLWQETVMLLSACRFKEELIMRKLVLSLGALTALTLTLAGCQAPPPTTEVVSWDGSYRCVAVSHGYRTEGFSNTRRRAEEIAMRKCYDHSAFPDGCRMIDCVRE